MKNISSNSMLIVVNVVLEVKMSKKMCYTLSIVLFVILCILLVCERMNPEAGSGLISMIFGH